MSKISCGTTSVTAPVTKACSVYLTSSTASKLTIALSSNNPNVTVPSPVTVAAGTSTGGFSATFASVQSTQTVTLTATYGGSSVYLTLTVNPTSVAAISVSSSSVPFGNTIVNSTATQALTLTSSGTAPLMISALTISGAGFSAWGITLPATLNPGQSATLTLSFDPATAGSASGALTVTNNSTKTPSAVISLSGTGMASLSALTCAGSAIVGPASVSCTATLNVAAPAGGQIVSLSSNNAAVSVPSSIIIPAGAASACFVATLSSVTSNQIALLTGSTNGVTRSFSLQDTAAIANLGVSTTTLSLGNVAVNTVASAPVTLTSTGTVPVTVASVSVSGTGFTVSGAPIPVTLNPGQSVPITVWFEPLTAGAAAGQLTIGGNSSTGPIQVSLSGSGVYSISGTTYYLAPQANGGNDSNSGLSPNLPWLTPNHPVKCGDVIVAAPSSAYNSDNFNSGQWGTVSCPAGNNVAWLECATFDGCKINSTRYGMYVDRSYWGVQGWEVTVSAPGTGFCFGAAPQWANPTEVHHIVFANNVANGRQEGGIVSFNMTNSTSVDYLSIVGNIAYNGSQNGSHCYSGISVYEPIQSDSAAGTHIYIAGNFSYGNFDPSSCNGTLPTDGEGIILDTFDGRQGGMAAPYIAAALVENNVLVSNGGRGFEVQNNTADSQHAAIYSRHNTIWGNNLDGNQGDKLCGEFLILAAGGTTAYANLIAAQEPTGCGGYPLYDFWTYQGDSTDLVYNNFLYGMSTGNTTSDDSGSFAYDTSNVSTQTAPITGAAPPAPPNCAGRGNVPGCMTQVILNFTPTSGSAAGYGYQLPGLAPISDALFPKWLCNVNLPAGLTMMGCLP